MVEECKPCATHRRFGDYYTFVKTINLLAIPEDHEYYRMEHVAQEMALLPKALKCDFMHFMIQESDLVS